MCIGEGRLQGQEERFRYLYRILDYTFHFEFHQTIEAMKDAYASIDPDADTHTCETVHRPDEPEFFDLLQDLLDKANYERVTEADLKQALKESSLFKIRLYIHFEDFEEVILFFRGVSMKTETVPAWFGLRSKILEFINYDRVVLFIRYGEESGKRSPTGKPNATVLKMFRNVPKADIEMLFPNTNVRMRASDKLLIGIPAVGGGIAAMAKLGPPLLLLGSLFGYWLGQREQPPDLNEPALIAFFVGLAAFIGYLWKQFSNFKNRKLKFMQELTKNLYFRNLDNNAGVFHRLANDAEDEECKEAMLAYYFLLTSDRPLSEAELDRGIEHWIAANYHCDIDFEVDDALRKLVRLKLVRQENGKLSVIPVEAAIAELDRQWDAYFTAS